MHLAQLKWTRMVPTQHFTPFGTRRRGFPASFVPCCNRKVCDATAAPAYRLVLGLCLLGRNSGPRSRVCSHIVGRSTLPRQTLTHPTFAGRPLRLARRVPCPKLRCASFSSRLMARCLHYVPAAVIRAIAAKRPIVATPSNERRHALDRDYHSCPRAQRRQVRRGFALCSRCPSVARARQNQRPGSRKDREWLAGHCCMRLLAWTGIRSSSWD
ncbi:hypothetical protein BCR44DRAFT_1426305 [Catenaria anguillulae PL171]|uniref:Uncharacterized protein n=1 Tax=Catenaria anguillulae PL171 TaxID=765915 RepID=A0A1Y2HXT1_9FUNG|nr:hypothetical protein BCR44DRAFT_1426305 [Catenaria anguillulae PL171]